MIQADFGQLIGNRPAGFCLKSPGKRAVACIHRIRNLLHFYFFLKIFL